MKDLKLKMVPYIHTTVGMRMNAVQHLQSLCHHRDQESAPHQDHVDSVLHQLARTQFDQMRQSFDAIRELFTQLDDL